MYIHTCKSDKKVIIMIQTGISGLINCNSQFTILTFSPTEFEFAVCISQIQNSYLAVLIIFQNKDKIQI